MELVPRLLLLQRQCSRPLAILLLFQNITSFDFHNYPVKLRLSSLSMSLSCLAAESRLQPGLPDPKPCVLSIFLSNDLSLLESSELTHSSNLLLFISLFSGLEEGVTSAYQR